jgi:hypothetical protein
MENLRCDGFEESGEGAPRLPASLDEDISDILEHSNSSLKILFYNDSKKL